MTMRSLRRFVALALPERTLVLRSLFVVAAVRLGLWLLPPTTLLRRVELSANGHKRKKPLARVDVPRIAWAVRAASRRVPGATCLTQALAARLLLARYGHTAQLRVGVRRSDKGAFEAHAWAEVEGRPVVGGRDAGGYKRLPDLLDALDLQDSERRTGESKA